jgi:hypothetical protein
MGWTIPGTGRGDDQEKQTGIHFLADERMIQVPGGKCRVEC